MSDQESHFFTYPLFPPSRLPLSPDPESGNVYRARMKLDGEGGKLSVRGFIGFAFLGRTQTWVRDK